MSIVEFGAERIRRALSGGRFAVTVELESPRGADAEALQCKAAMLRDWVDAVNVTDSADSRVRMSSLGAAVLVQRAGLAPVMQVTCRDRNRMALQSDLVAAGALGVPHVLLLNGDQLSSSDHPEAKPVFDVDGIQLMTVARALRDQGELMSGEELAVRPRWTVGTVENPSTPLSLSAERIAKKVAAGAEFVQTSCVFDVGVFVQWMARLRDMGVTERCAILAGVRPIRSLPMLEFLRGNAAGVNLPDEIDRRLRGVPPNRVADEGIRLCVETIQQLAEIPEVAGVHVMAAGFEHVVPEIVERAGVGPRAVAALAGAHGEAS